MAVDLSQLLDPKRAEREEGWHNFAQSYERSMSALSDAIKKLSGSRQLEEGESAFTVLESYLEEQRNKADLDREKSQRLLDMISASVPEITEEQRAAYEAQKKLYDQYRDELKKQTSAVQAAADAQIAAISREEKEKMSLLDAQAAQLKRAKGGDLTKGLESLADISGSASKSDGKDTLMSTLFAGAKDFLGKKQAEREALIDEVVELQRREIQSESEARKAAIAEESKARIQAIEREVEAQAKLAGADKAPETPEEARAKLVVGARDTLSKNKAFMERSAAQEPIVRKQQEFLQAELQREAAEEQAGEYLSPAVEEDALPGTASTAPVVVEEPTAEAEDVAASEKVEKATSPEKDAGSGKVVGKALDSDVSESLASIATGVGGITPAVAGVALPLALGAQALKDIDEALPIVTSALGALGEGTKLLGPIILSTAWELGGYMAEGVANIVEAIERAASPFNTRRENLEETGAIAKVRKEVEEAQKKKSDNLDRALNSALSEDYTGASAILKRVEPIYTTPVDERERSRGTESPAINDDAVREAVTAMLVAQEQAARRQAELGQGAVPLQLSVPSIESFNM